MKVAIIHDWLVTNAGAEKVLKEIITLYPNADIYSLVNFLNKDEKKDILDNKNVRTSFIQKLPFSRKIFRNYLPHFIKAIESFDLSEYDLIISSSWAVAKGIKKNDMQLHICYCHTPIRYAWDLYDEYTSNLRGLKKILVKRALKKLRKWDLSTVNRVDYFIANSKFVSERIQRTYGRESTVIYPPIDIKKFTQYNNKEDFYLTASRLVSYKKTKLIVKSFVKMPDKKLVVIGAGEEYKEIKKIAKKSQNISVLGFCNDKIMIETMQKAKAFIYAAVEDFGIVPIEAMSCGTPVIALNEGGTAETVRDGVNGIHFNSQTTEEIVKAVNRFEMMNFNSKEISKDAHVYSQKRFLSEINNFILHKINNK